MPVVSSNTIVSVKGFESSISPNGQITLPNEIRTLLKLKPKDKVTIRVEGEEIKVVPKKDTLRMYFQSVPALRQKKSWEEIRSIAWEDATKDGR